MPGALARIVNACLAPFGAAIVRRGPGSASYRHVPLPPGAEAELRLDHPRVLELEHRYAGHPAALRSEWSNGYIREQVPLPYFRGDSAYVWQLREDNDELRYVLTALYAAQHDALGLLDRLGEDGAYGAHVYEVDGRLVGRDLLDSVAELTFLEDAVGLVRPERFTILDIGAGYGRFAHRVTQAFDNVACVLTDAVPLSTFLSEQYLAMRAAERVSVVPLDEVKREIRTRQVDLAVNVHSFSECPAAAIEWWLDLIAAAGVPRLFVVPNHGERFLSTETSGEQRDFLPAIESRGYRLAASRPKYHHSEAVQRFGIFPSHYFLFTRD